MDNSDIRRCFSEDLSDPDEDLFGVGNENNDDGSDLDFDIPEYESDSNDDVSLMDFSSGSDDNYSPHTSELETSDREETEMMLMSHLET